MPERDGGPAAALASFTATGEVDGIWPAESEPLELVLRDGRLLPRTPTEMLPKDARIALLGWRRGADGRPALVLDGANLLLGPRRVSPSRPELLADGDVLTVDPHDVGERPDAIRGALLVTLDTAVPRPLRCLREREDGAVEVTRPRAGRLWLQAGVAVTVFGALPAVAAALAEPAGSPRRSALVLVAAAAALTGVVAFGLSRLLAHAGPVLSWDREGLHIARGGPLGRPELLPLERLDGFAVRLARRPAGRWTLEAILRTRAGELRLDDGPHLHLADPPSPPALAALEARRLDWIEVGRRAARAWGRSPDAFVTVHTDTAWPPERARGAVAAGRISLT